MNASRWKFGQDIINPLFEDYRSFVLGAIESKEECGTLDKCHTEAHIQEIRILVCDTPATAKSVFNVGSESVSVAI